MAKNKTMKTANGSKRVTRKSDGSISKSNLANGSASKIDIPEENHHNGAEKSASKRKKLQNSSADKKTLNAVANSTGKGKLGSGAVLKRKGEQPSIKSHRNKKLSITKKYTLRSVSNGTRVLRSRTKILPQDEPKDEINSTDNNTIQSIQKQKRKSSKKKKRDGLDDELVRTRKRVKYLLLKIAFEQNMIDAYSSEGWRGQSQEKIRPEKELEKAATKILQYKLAIREILHHLHSLSLQGALDSSCFDSDGLLVGEDIYCAKCLSKDLLPDNDIILCDGACDRGFHQKCLDPSLATEDIPQGEEGWLCPDCDCKIDCLELVNDHMGTDFEIEDSWEKVFPEAARTSNGDLEGINTEGMKSDDSEDDDYDPERPESPAIHQEGGNLGERGSTSDEDDSDSDEEDSDSDEDNSNSSGDNGNASSDDDSSHVSLEDDLGVPKQNSVGSGKKQKRGNGCDQLERSELLKMLDSEKDIDVDSIVTEKRRHQEVDYKQLHEEVFGFSDRDSMSEDDEEWGKRKPPSKRRGPSTKNLECATPKTEKAKISSATKRSGKSSARKCSESRHKEQKHLEEPPLTPKADDACTPTAGNVSTPIANSNSSPQMKKNASQKHPSAVVEKLQMVFAKNQFPPKSEKEKLAAEVGLTYKQVDKWFVNRRNSLRSSNKKEKSVVDDQAPTSIDLDGGSVPGKGQGSSKKRKRSAKRVFSENEEKENENVS